jgi:hypothetical protein
VADVVSVDVLQALLRYQDYKCAVTGEAFELPPDVVYPINAIPATTQPYVCPGLAPVLARIWPYEPWSIDNVLLIIGMIQTFYTHVGGYSGIKGMLSRQTGQPLLPPTKQKLLALMAPEPENITK